MKKVFRSILVLAIALAAAMPLVSSAWTYHYVTVSGAGNQDGTSYDNAFAGIQAGINAAASGDWVMVAAGVYPPILSSNKQVVIWGDSASAADTIIDGGGTNRCATLIADDADKGGNTALVNLTLRNGNATSRVIAEDYKDCGAGARGGYLLNCIVENCTARYGGGVADGDHGMLHHPELRGRSRRRRALQPLFDQPPLQHDLREEPRQPDGQRGLRMGKQQQPPAFQLHGRRQHHG